MRRPKAILPAVHLAGSTMPLWPWLLLPPLCSLATWFIAMDPISGIASVVGVIGFFAASAQELNDFVSGTRNAPAEIAAVSEDVKVFRSLIFSLQRALFRADVQNVISHDDELKDALLAVEGPIRSCAKLLKRLVTKLEPYVREGQAADGMKSFKTSVKWTWNKKEILAHVQDFNSAKSTLNMALSSIPYIIEVQKYGAASSSKPRRNSTDTDAGFALERLVDEKSRSLDQSDTFSEYAVIQGEEPPQISPADPDVPPSYKTNISSPSLQPSDSLTQRASSQDLLLEVELAKRNFHEAAKSENLVLIKRLLPIVSVDMRDDNGRSALSIAAQFGNEETAKFLLEHGASVNNRAFKIGGYVEYQFVGGRTPLHWAAVCGSPEMIKLLLQYNADVNARNSTQRTAIQEAAKDGNPEAVRVLIENNANPDLQDDNGWNALHEVATYGQVEIAESLLKGGANTEIYLIRGKDQRFTPLLHALHCICRPSGPDDTAMVKLLIKYGANVNAPTENDVTCLHHASAIGWFKAVVILVEAGAKLEAVERFDYETPLHKAAKENRQDIIPYLVHKGASLYAKNSKGMTPVELAHSRGHHFPAT